MNNPNSGPDELQRYPDAQLESGCLDQARNSDELAESVKTVQRALAELDRGERGRPLDDFVDEFRSQHQIARDA
jgi:hypothetical protein